LSNSYLFRVSIFGIHFSIDDAFELVKECHKSKDSKKHMPLKRIMEKFKDKLDLINTGIEGKLSCKQIVAVPIIPIINSSKKVINQRNQRNRYCLRV